LPIAIDVTISWSVCLSVRSLCSTTEDINTVFAYDSPMFPADRNLHSQIIQPTAAQHGQFMELSLLRSNGRCQSDAKSDFTVGFVIHINMVS